MTTRRAKFADAVSVYDELMREGNADIGVVLAYGEGEGLEVGELEVRSGNSTDRKSEKRSAFEASPNSSLITPNSTLDVIGAGNFARTMLLPHLKGRIALGTIVNATGLSARHVKEKFGFANAETDSAKVFASTGGTPRSIALMIGTRHHLHAPLVLEGLKANKHVFVEKPLCLTRDELGEDRRRDVVQRRAASWSASTAASRRRRSS